ncbi:penicillin-binding protein 1A [Ideonella sp. BN130291]|uniref:penicillin-binding protein 1A n=1 Tax=Ideonella sp. BN130291 TaxID=3112940 RepID=UPI002E25447F|nr:PBP1A family penicillin-binding protein [Ideonella sp. BN130291]
MFASRMRAFLHRLVLRFRAASRPAQVLAGAAALAGLLLLYVVVMCAWYYPQLPALDKVVDYEPAQSLQVFTRDGVELGQFGAERRQFVPIAKVPRLLQDAVVAVEDVRFREHHGIDLRGVLRAVLANLTPGGMPQGASTITQQVARTFFLSTRRTTERKLKEAMLALKIEQQLSKDEILELYLNQIFLGQRAYGFAAAAQVYFGKPLDALSVAEVAMLAGLPQNPGFANPITSFDKARQRQLIVLRRMRVVGVIDDAQLAAAEKEKLQIRSPLKAFIHAEYVAEMARQAVHERYGDAAYTKGYRVHTSLVSQDQQTAWAAVRRGVLAYDRKQPYRGPEDHEDLPDGGDEAQAATRALKYQRDDEELRVALVTEAQPKRVEARLASGDAITLDDDSLRWASRALQPRAPAELALRRGAVIRVVERKGAKGQVSWSLAQWPEVQSAFVSLDAATGRVRALVGGFDFRRAQFNHATQAWRQPGSSFKPFLYSAALEHGVMPNTLVNDAPFVEGNWEPQNSDGNFDGPITLRQALARSKNMVSIRVLQRTGINDALQWTSRFGFDTSKQPANLTLALGAGSTTPLQLASAYAVLANGGYRVAPLLIERITDAQGKVVYEAPAPSGAGDDNRVLSARNVFIMQSLLQEVTHAGTAARAGQALRRADVYGKTGTTNDAVDAWFAGFQPSVVAVAWMGYDNPRSLGSRESGGGLALPIWIDYMARALKGVPEQAMAPPDGVARVGLNGVEDWIYADLPADMLTLRIDVEEPAWAPAVAEPASASSP